MYIVSLWCELSSLIDKNHFLLWPFNVIRIFPKTFNFSANRPVDHKLRRKVQIVNLKLISVPDKALTLETNSVSDIFHQSEHCSKLNLEFSHNHSFKETWLVISLILSDWMSEHIFMVMKIHFVGWQQWQHSFKMVLANASWEQKIYRWRRLISR